MKKFIIPAAIAAVVGFFAAVTAVVHKKYGGN